MPERGLPAGLGWTALLVARARAIESESAEKLIDDQFAAAFVSAARQAGADADKLLPANILQDEVDRWRTDSVAVRTRFFDDYLAAASNDGCRQIVLLAAGLDARAFRLSWPAGTRIFEVDLADVFAFKAGVLARLAAMPTCQRVTVPVDLRDDWPRQLKAATFDSSQPTVWLVEGLLMYLEEADRDRLMERIAALSSAGSRIGLDHRAGFFAPPSFPANRGGQPTTEAFTPLATGVPSLTQPESWLAGHGWRVILQHPADLSATYNRAIPPPLEATAPGSAQSWLGTGELRGQ